MPRSDKKKQRTIGERLQKTCAKLMVGRELEVRLFDEFIKDSSPHAIFYVHGPAGVGKSMLLSRLRDRAESKGAKVGYLSGDFLSPEPKLLSEKIWDVLDLSSPGTGSAEESTTFNLLILDAFEHLQPAHDWLLKEFLGTLPENIKIVLASRRPSEGPLWAESGWRDLTESVELSNFSFDEATDYLNGRGVPTVRQEEVIRVTHAHPLALSLVADMLRQTPEAEVPLECSPDLVQQLLSRFTVDVPTFDHRKALWVAAMVSFCTQQLLGNVLSVDDAASLFDWLCNLSFSRLERKGVFLHELIKDLLVSDLRWRDPDLYRSICQQIIETELNSLEHIKGDLRRMKIADILFVISQASMRPERIFEAHQAETFQVKPPEQEDWKYIEDMVVMHEGRASLKPLKHWRKQGAETVVYSRENQPPDGFSLMLRLHEIPPEVAKKDPGVSSIHGALSKRYGDKSPPKATLLFRYWMTADTYQAPSELQSRIFLHIIEQVLSTPDLSFMISVHQDPECWIPLTAAAEISHFPDGDFQLGGQVYGIFGNDFRKRSTHDWSKRSIMMSLGFANRAFEERAKLSREEFNLAVKKALHCHHRPDRLEKSPLLSSSLLMKRCSPNSDTPTKVDELRRLLVEVAESFRECEKDEVLYHIMDKTFFHPVAKQVVAADELNLSFSTYRRYLNQAVRRITDVLWKTYQDR